MSLKLSNNILLILLISLLLCKIIVFLMIKKNLLTVSFGGGNDSEYYQPGRRPRPSAPPPSTSAPRRPAAPSHADSTSGTPSIHLTQMTQFLNFGFIIPSGWAVGAKMMHACSSEHSLTKEFTNVSASGFPPKARPFSARIPCQTW